MTKDNLVTVAVGTTLDEAERCCSSIASRNARRGQRYNLKGLITVKDIQKKLEYPIAAKDEQGRLRVGAAIGSTGDYLERAVELPGKGGCAGDRQRARALDARNGSDPGTEEAAARHAMSRETSQRPRRAGIDFAGD